MRLETRAELGKQGVEIASVRGTLQALAESASGFAFSMGVETRRDHVKYLQKRISDMEEKLADVQHKLNEIEWGEK
jgi:hypothetical protein